MSAVFAGLRIALAGKFHVSHTTLASMLSQHGGEVVQKIKDAHVLVHDKTKHTSKWDEAVRFDIPIVNASWLSDSIAQQLLQTQATYFLFTATKSLASILASNPLRPPKGKKRKRQTANETKVATMHLDDEEEKEEKKEKESDEPEPEQKKTIIIKGKAPVDEYCPDGMRYHVYEGSDGTVWDAMLNQTNIGANANKFYVIQLLETDGGNEYAVWNRWGRVGVRGQTTFQRTGTYLEGAQEFFKRKFKDKSGRAWEDRAQSPKPRKYAFLERNFEVKPAETENTKAEKTKEKKEEVVSKLPVRVQSLVELICDVGMMTQAMISLDYDVKKMPLGQLSKAHIQKGFAVLSKMGQELKVNDSDTATGPMDQVRLQDLSNEFYTLIPHNFSMHVPPVINTKAALAGKIRMMEALAEVELAFKLLNTATNNNNDKQQLHPIDEHYLQLRCGLEPLDPQGTEMALLKKYVQNTHASTHAQYRSLDVLDAFAVDRQGEDARFRLHENNPNRMLLWHGSRLTNFVGILSQGLRIAPPEAPVTGYMFGKGVYFADMASKSANYCCPSGGIGLMLLCEVALGTSRQLLHADYNAGLLPPGTMSTKGCGGAAPDPRDYEMLNNGCVVPCGKEVKTGFAHGGSALLYNEYIVYDVNQIKIRYLMKMQFSN